MYVVEVTGTNLRPVKCWTQSLTCSISSVIVAVSVALNVTPACAFCRRFLTCAGVHSWSAKVTPQQPDRDEHHRPARDGLPLCPELVDEGEDQRDQEEDGGDAHSRSVVGVMPVLAL